MAPSTLWFDHAAAVGAVKPGVDYVRNRQGLPDRHLDAMTKAVLALR